jgi:chemotaxis protein MotB
MSDPEDRTSPHEIVVVRRRSGGHDEGHHGGAWKIAFADFMTALMCFFLVMWLINASDKKTITQIATYFNPTRLNDRITTEKGLHDPRDAPSLPNARDLKKAKNDIPKPAPIKNHSKAKAPKLGDKGEAQEDDILAGELDLIRDPDGVIDEILKSHAANGPPARAARSPGMPRDLFDRDFGGPLDQEPNRLEGLSDGSSGRDVDTSQKVDPGGARTDPSAVRRKAATAKRLESEIETAVAGIGMDLKMSIDVRKKGDEVLVSISDDVKDAMFSIGSSRPTPALIGVIDAIGKVIVRRGGRVVIRGHTDARPYNVGGFDNWRLSSARAHTAYTLLVRSGFPATSVQRIEGHADRFLRRPREPLWAGNRRIEILIAMATP